MQAWLISTGPAQVRAEAGAASRERLATTPKMTEEAGMMVVIFADMLLLYVRDGILKGSFCEILKLLITESLAVERISIGV